MARCRHPQIADIGNPPAGHRHCVMQIFNSTLASLICCQSRGDAGTIYTNIKRKPSANVDTTSACLSPCYPIIIQKAEPMVKTFCQIMSDGGQKNCILSNQNASTISFQSRTTSGVDYYFNNLLLMALPSFFLTN